MPGEGGDNDLCKYALIASSNPSHARRRVLGAVRLKRKEIIMANEDITPKLPTDLEQRLRDTGWGENVDLTPPWGRHVSAHTRPDFRQWLNGKGPDSFTWDNNKPSV